MMLWMESVPFISAIKMPFNLLLSSALSNAEALLNRAIMLDPKTKNKLTNLHGTIFSIKCTSPEFSIFITVLEEGFLLSPVIAGEANAEISGSAHELSKLLFAKEKSSVIRNNKIFLKGDANSIQDLQTIIFELDIDWEYRLSKIIGDIPTQVLSESLDSIKNFLDESADSFKIDIHEYIHEEVKLIPTAHELEDFYYRIDALRLRLDRNHARLTRLEI